MNNVTQKNDYTATKVLTTAGAAIGASTLTDRCNTLARHQRVDNLRSWMDIIPDEFKPQEIINEQKECLNKGLRDFMPNNLELHKLQSEQFKNIYNKAFKANLINRIRGDVGALAGFTLAGLSLGLLIDGIKNAIKNRKANSDEQI